MTTSKQIADLIEAAKGDLEQALQQVQQLPALDWGAVRYALHTLGNYLNITSACVHLLGSALESHPDPEVTDYLHGLERTTELMTHLMRHLSHASASREVPLLSERVDLARMVRRGCAYYQSVSDIKRIEVLCEVEDPVA